MGKNRVRTCMNRRNSMAYRSRVMDQEIEQILDTGRYTDKKMLVLKNPYSIAPLTALIVFATEKPCSVRVTLDDGKILDQRTEFSTRHRIPVYGLHAGQENRIGLEIWDETGCREKRGIVVRTCALPRCLNGQILIREKKDTSACSLTMAFGGDTKYPYAFDEEGEVRYYIRKKTKSYGIYRLSEGHFLFLSPWVEVPSFSNPHSALAREMDVMGRVYREYLIPDGLHHDGCEMVPGGNLLTLSSSLDQHVEDAVIEIDRVTGKVVKRLNLGDVLSEHPYFDLVDWAHLNTVSYQPKDHTILVCARNLHSVLKIDWESGELIWILCDTSFWKGTPYEDKVLSPQGDISFFYQAHAAYFLSGDGEKDKRLIIYDNHWNKRRPVDSFDGDRKSYVRIYAIDERRNTVTLQSSYRTTKSKIRSNGVVLGDRVFAMSGALVKQIGGYKGRITEFDQRSGKIINDYLTKTDFYRAYPFFAEYEALCRPLDEGPRILGDREEVEECTGMWEKKRPVKKQLPEVQVHFYEDTLLAGGVDHQIQKIIFRGREHSYVKDFSHTVQTNPRCFGSMKYCMPVPTSRLDPDCYRIYVQSDGSLYDTKKKFRIVS